MRQTLCLEQGAKLHCPEHCAAPYEAKLQSMDKRCALVVEAHFVYFDNEVQEHVETLMQKIKEEATHHNGSRGETVN